MKETISVRLDYELIRDLRLDECPNKSDCLREKLREYLRLKESQAGLEEIKDRLRLIEEKLTELEGKEDCTRAVEGVRNDLRVLSGNQKAVWERVGDLTAGVEWLIKLQYVVIGVLTLVVLGLFYLLFKG